MRIAVIASLMLGFGITALASGVNADEFLFGAGLPEPVPFDRTVEGKINYESALAQEMAQTLDQAEAENIMGKQPAESVVAQPPRPIQLVQAQTQANRQSETAWFQPQNIQGEIYETVKQRRTLIEFYNKYYWHNTKFDESGNRKSWDSNGQYYETRSELKIEHNLNEQFNVLCEIPYKVAVWKDDYNRNTTSGLGDVWFKLKYKVFDPVTQPFYFAIQPGLRYPGGYDANASPSLGGREIASEVRFIAAYNFASLPLYLKTELAYRYRAEGFTAEIPHYLELSYYPQDWLMFKTTLDGIEGLTGTGDIEEDWTKWTAHVIFSPNHAFGDNRDEEIWKFEFAYGNTFEGKNTSNGTETVFNVSYEF